MKTKMYSFSVQKHAHDIHLYRNTLYSKMCDMENGDIDRDDDFIEWYNKFYFGDLEELYLKMFDSRDGRIVYLTGKQIALAKEIVLWAGNRRENALMVW